jgi:hypothetical protein
VTTTAEATGWVRPPAVAGLYAADPDRLPDDVVTAPVPAVTSPPGWAIVSSSATTAMIPATIGAWK